MRHNIPPPPYSLVQAIFLTLLLGFLAAVCNRLHVLQFVQELFR